jgi:hypothetical protein
MNASSRPVPAQRTRRVACVESKPKNLTCSTCKAFTTTDDNGGHCQRHPPTVFTTHQGSIGYWPPVRKDSWCLEHVRK